MSWCFGRVSSLAMAGLAAAVLAGAPAPVSAQSKAIEATFSKLDAVVTGRITDRCELAGGGEISFGELTGQETAVAQLALNCNVPFQLGLQSARGGLTHATLPMGQGPFAGQLGYTVDIRVPTLSPRPAVLQASFNGTELQTRRTLDSGESIAAGGGRLEFTTLRPRGAGLLAGEYSETLTVTLTPNL